MNIHANNRPHMPQPVMDFLIRSSEQVQGEGVEVQYAEDGSPVAYVQRQGSAKLTNSKISPIQEAEQWAAQMHREGSFSIRLIYGCGFGYPLLAAHRNKATNEVWMIFEQDVQMLAAMFAHMDMQVLLRDASVYWMLGDQQEMLAYLHTCIDGTFIYRCTHLATTFTPFASRYDQTFYLRLHRAVLDLMEWLTMSIGNTIHDTLAGVHNTLGNVKAMLTNPALSRYRNLYANKPAYIIASGPSLDLNLHHLHDAVGKGLLLCAESALLPCLRAGILVDAVCVTERTPNVYHLHFADQPLPEELSVVGLTVMDPRIAGENNRPWIPVFRRSELSVRWVREAICPDEQGLQGGTSSAHLAFELALWTGANPIVFVGQDLAFGPERITHSKQSAYMDDRLRHQADALRQQQTLLVPGMNGEMVETTAIWSNFKTWFEHQIRMHPDRTFIDATEGGALIAGTQLASLSDVVKAHFDDERVQSLYAQAQRLQAHVSLDSDERREQFNRLVHRLDEHLMTLTQLVEQSEADDRICRILRTIYDLHQRYKLDHLPDFAQILLKHVSDLDHKFVENPELSTYFQHLVYAYRKRLIGLGTVNTPEKLQQYTAALQEMNQMLQTTSQHVAQSFKAMRAYLQTSLAVASP